VWKRLLGKPRLELAKKVYSDWEDVTSSGRAFQVFGASNRESMATELIDDDDDGGKR